MVIMSKFMTVRERVSGKMLGDYAEGDIVLLNESGSPVEFYVAKHDYESGLNGAGRTLLVRKGLYDKRTWNTVAANAYATSGVDAWLNGEYKTLLDTEVQTAIENTKFYYTPGNGTYSVSTLERSVFFLSLTELGLSISKANVEGEVLPISEELNKTYYNNIDVYQLTRTPRTGGSSSAFAVNNKSIVYFSYNATGNLYSRPCFTLPVAALFDPNTNQFKGVS